MCQVRERSWFGRRGRSVASVSRSSASASCCIRGTAGRLPVGWQSGQFIASHFGRDRRYAASSLPGRQPPTLPLRNVGGCMFAHGPRQLTMRSSGLRGHSIVFPDVLSARSRLTRRWASLLEVTVPPKALVLLCLVLTAPCLATGSSEPSLVAENRLCELEPGESAKSVWHFLYFSSESDAESAVRALPTMKYRHQVMAPLDSDRWTLFLEHTPVPADAQDLDVAKVQLKELAKSIGGEYGWHGCESHRAS
jgi:hypothetical protein